MDLKKAILKVSHYLLLESSELNNLKNDLEKLTQNLSLVKKNQKKNIRDEKIINKIEKKINNLIKKIEKLLNRTKRELAPWEKDYLKSLKEHFEISRKFLIKILANGGELDSALTKKNFDKAKNLINQALGNNENPGIRSLLLILDEISKPKSKVNEIFTDKIISGESKVYDFEEFFDYLNDNFIEVNSNKILNDSKVNAAKGISFLVVVRSLIYHKDLEIRSNKAAYANVLKLRRDNFGLTWVHGINLDQNFSLTIYFNLNDLVGLNQNEKIIAKGYTESYLKEITAASPKKARELLEQGVIRVEGYLPWNKIRYLGFRYRQSNEFKFKFFKLI